MGYLLLTTPVGYVIGLATKKIQIPIEEVLDTEQQTETETETETEIETQSDRNG